MMIKKAALILMYVFYAVVLTAVLLIVRFPQNTFLAYMEDIIEQELPGFTCDIEDFNYHYPLTLRFERIRLAKPTELPDIAIPVMQVSLEPKKPVTGFHVDGELFGGSVAADILVHRTSGMLEFDPLSVNNIDLTEIAMLRQRIDRPVNGKVDFTGSFIGYRHHLGGGDLNGQARFTDLQFDLKRPILQSDAVTFTEVTTTSSLHEGVLTLAGGSATGPVYGGSFAGEIRIAAQWQESEVDLGGEIAPDQEYLRQDAQMARVVALLRNKYGKETIPYTISGTVREPVFSFGQQ